MLSVEERIITTAVGKVRKQLREERQREAARQQGQSATSETSRPSTGGYNNVAQTDVPPQTENTEPVLTAEEEAVLAGIIPESKPATPSAINLQTKRQKDDELFLQTEQLLIQMIIRHGEKVMCNIKDQDGTERPIAFRHALSAPDDLEKDLFTNTMHQSDENSIMNLGHGRAGHLPDYSFLRYKYLPAWADYEECVKDNPADYYRAFCQMIYALKYLRAGEDAFQLDTYDEAAAAPYEEEIRAILEKRQLSASQDWKAFGEKLSGSSIEAFDLGRWQAQYRAAADKDVTFLGRFILAALAQKSMVTNRIFASGNLVAGFSVNLKEKGFKGLRDFSALIRYFSKEDAQ